MRPDRIGHAHSFHSGAHVMHAHDMSAAQDRRCDCSHSAMYALVDGRAAKQVSYEGLARCADEQREIRKFACELVQSGDQFYVLLFGLAEAYARIKHNAVARYATTFGL